MQTHDYHVCKHTRRQQTKMHDVCGHNIYANRYVYAYVYIYIVFMYMICPHTSCIFDNHIQCTQTDVLLEVGRQGLAPACVCADVFALALSRARKHAHARRRVQATYTAHAHSGMRVSSTRQYTACTGNTRVYTGV
jgi:hypothetical protein